MSEVIDRAKKALEGISEGPWEAQDWTSHANGERGCGILAGVGMKQRGIAWTGMHHWNPEDVAQADAEFIAESRTLIPDLVAELEATQRLLDDLTASDIGEVTAHRDELWAERNALLQRNAALHAEVARLGGGVR